MIDIAAIRADRFRVLRARADHDEHPIAFTRGYCSNCVWPIEDQNCWKCAETMRVREAVAQRNARKAKRLADRKPPRDLKPCGSEAAYKRHIRKGETCDICNDARKTRRQAERKAS